VTIILASVNTCDLSDAKLEFSLPTFDSVSDPMIDTPPQPDKRPLCVLIVEDEGLIRMMVAETLADVGFRVTEAANAKEALEALNTAAGGELCAVVLDIGLPDMNGEVLTQKIRALRPEIPVVMTTGYDTSDLRKKTAADLNLRILMKPFQLEALVEALKELGITTA
jgi:DNA-binding NtrC family response regulator